MTVRKVTIDQALRSLRWQLTKPDSVVGVGTKGAINLGIEALVHVKNLRVIELDPKSHHLPSEPVYKDGFLVEDEEE